MRLRRLRFVLRWALLYNVILVWLTWRLPKRLPETGLEPAADGMRQRAHMRLAQATSACGAVCSDCGRCCLESVDRFTPFDVIVRANADVPAPSADRRIYSVPWMIWNSVLHFLQGVSGQSKRRQPRTCRHLTAEGCSLPREQRPMICVSWFCLRTATSLDERAMAMAERPLRIIEELHREALRAARSGRGRRE